MEDLFRAFSALLREFDDNDAVREAIVFAAWKKIAGDALRQHTAPFELRQKRLFVAVRSETWRKHLESLAGQMIFKLNSLLGSASVTMIEFRVNEDLVATALDTRKTEQDEIEFRRLAIDELTPKIRASAEAIKDEALRETFLLAAGGCLVRKKRLR